MTAIRIPAVFMRGGTSKGVFFHAADLPADPAARDRLLMRVVGSPDRYGKQIDGMGCGTSSTSKVVLMSKSTRDDCDVDYHFGHVAIDAPVIDWSGNCGNLTAAVGPFAISEGLVDAPRDGLAVVRIWQVNIGKRIVAHVPMKDGEVQEDGDFELDGVAFPAAEIRLQFMDPGADDAEGDAPGGIFPTGRRVDRIEVPGVGTVEATLINAGNPTVFIEAATLGLGGTELQPEINGRPELLARAEAIRSHGALAMGLVASAAEATATRPATPKLCFVSPSAAYVASDGRVVDGASIGLVARIFSMGPLHHAMTGTGAVAIAVAAAIDGTIVQRLARPEADGTLRFGHPSGTLRVGAEARRVDGDWVVTQATMSRSARRLMEGWVRVPA